MKGVNAFKSEYEVKIQLQGLIIIAHELFSINLINKNIGTSSSIQ